jgi:phage-related protein
VTGLVQNLPAIIQALIEAAPQILFGIIGALLENTPLLIEAFTTLFTSLAQALPSIVMVLVQSIPQSFVEIGNAFMGLLPILQDVFTQLMAALGPTFSQIGQYAQMAWDAIVKAFGNVGTWMSQKFTTAVNNVKNAFNTLKTFFKTTWDAIKNIFSDVGTKFLSVGQDIVAGIQKGLSSSWANLKAFLSKACGDLIALAKRILGIGSPSKEFADQVGQWIPAGIAEGIKDNIKVLNNAINGMTGDMLQTSVSGTMETINSVNYVPSGPVGSEGGNIIINNDIKVNGAQDPEAWTQTFISTLKREARMA